MCFSVLHDTGTRDWILHVLFCFTWYGNQRLNTSLMYFSGLHDMGTRDWILPLCAFLFYMIRELTLHSDVWCFCAQWTWARRRLRHWHRLCGVCMNFWRTRTTTTGATRCWHPTFSTAALCHTRDCCTNVGFNCVLHFCWNVIFSLLAFVSSVLFLNCVFVSICSFFLCNWHYSGIFSTVFFSSFFLQIWYATQVDG